MELLWITALSVGGATILGGIAGFGLRCFNAQINTLFLSAAAGIMLAAAIVGLIVPMLCAPLPQVFMLVLGMLLGAAFLRLMGRWIPVIFRHWQIDCGAENPEIGKALLFVAAIAAHNFPEGFAAGVSFGCPDSADTLLIVLGIILQNLPEGMAVVPPLLKAGVANRYIFLCAVLTGIAEIVGTLLGYSLIHLCGWILPFELGFAAGTMLYIVTNEIIPETHCSGCAEQASTVFLVGFCLLLLLDCLL